MPRYAILSSLSLLLLSSQLGAESLVSAIYDHNVLINNSVNVVSGEYLDSSADLIVNCAEPFSIMRTHASSEAEEGDYGLWRIAEDHVFLFFKRSTRKPKDERDHYYDEISLRERSGSVLNFEIPQWWGVYFKNKNNCTLVPSETWRFCNTHSGTIGGGTNRKNDRLIYTHPGGFELVKGSGERRIYTGTYAYNRYWDTKKVHTEDYYGLKEERRPNGNRLVYAHDGQGRVTEIKALNCKLELLGWAKMAYRDEADKTFMRVETSDHNWAEYLYTTWSSGKRHVQRLQSVKSSRMAPVQYSYNGPDFRLSDVHLANGVGLHIDYRQSNHGINVAAQFAPLAHSPFPVCAATYDYWQQQAEEYEWVQHEEGDGGFRTNRYPTHTVTKVQDGCGFISEYKSSVSSGQLEEIVRYSGDYGKWDRCKTVCEQFEWGDPKGPDKGNLIRKKVVGIDGNTIAERNLTYDASGNVLRETLYGKLTGSQKDSYSKYCSYSQDGMNLLLSESDGETTTVYAYKPGTNLCTLKLRSGKGCYVREMWEYDDNARVVREVVDNGSSQDPSDLTGVTERRIKCIVARMEEPARGLPEIIEERYWDGGEERLLRKTHLHYSERNQVIQRDLYDADGLFRYSLFTKYDELGRVIEETDPLGRITRVRRDCFGNVVETDSPTSATGLRTLSTYDLANRLVKTEKIDRTGVSHVIHYRYDYRGSCTSTWDSRGLKTSYTYDFLNHPVTETTTTLCLNDDELTLTKQREFDPFGNCTKEEDDMGPLFSRSYTIRGQPLRQDFPDGTYETFEYTESGRLICHRARNGTVTRYTRDGLGRVTREETLDSNGQLLRESSSTYDGSRLISQTDGEGVTTSYRYNGALQLIEVSSGDHRTTYEWDALGRKHKEISWPGEDASNRVSLFEYDLLDRLTEERLEDLAGTVYKRVEYGYDSDGNRNSVVTYNHLGERIEERTEFDGFQRPIKKIDALGHVTTYRYIDGPNPKHIVIDPNGQVTESTLNGRGALLEVERTTPFGKLVARTHFSINQRGQKIRQVETVMQPKGPPWAMVLKWAYNAMGQVEKLEEGVATPKHRVTQLRYNTCGQLEGITKPSGATISYEYDPLGRLHTERGDGFTYSYSYDRNDRLLQVVDGEGHITRRTYAQTGELLEEELANGLKMAYRYDGCGRTIEQRLPDGSRLSFDYTVAFLTKVNRFDQSGHLAYAHEYTKIDPRGLVLHSKLPERGGELTYSWDDNGRCKSISHHSKAFSAYHEEVPDGGFDAVGHLLAKSVRDPVGSFEERFTYDNLYHLTSEEGAASHTYSHDSIHNRLSCDERPYEINALNELLDDAESQYEYDFDGRLIKRHSRGESVTYSYDGLDRLTGMESATLSLHFTYDPFHRRMSKETVAKDLPIKAHLRFLYVDQNEVGAVDSSGKMVEFRALGLGRGAEIGAAVAIELDNTLYIPIHDRRGSPVALLNRSGAVIESYRYTAFGERQIFSQSGERQAHSAIGHPWSFCSKRIDEESGLLFFGRRYYQCETGRWITSDPKGYAAGPNLYAYCLSSPLDLQDLYGLYPGNGMRERDNLPQGFPNPLEALGSLFGTEDRSSRSYGSPNGSLDKSPISEPSLEAGTSSHSPNTGTQWGSMHRPPPPQPISGAAGEEYPASSDLVVNYTNGIMNTHPDARKAAETLSNHLERPVGYTYNPTFGFFGDLWKHFAMFCGFKHSEAERVIEEKVSNIRSGLARIGPSGIGVYTCHSGGVAVMRSAIRRLTLEERGRMVVVACGGPVRISSREGLHGVINIIATNDPVARIIGGLTSIGEGASNHCLTIKSPRTHNMDHEFLKAYEEISWRIIEQTLSRMEQQYIGPSEVSSGYP